jgi:hypothetical protein
LDISIESLVSKVTSGFSMKYTHFKEFQQNAYYSKYWNKCIEAISDKELLSNLIFCNDIFCIPPVKTFLTYFENDFVVLTGHENAELEIFVKKSIGAFWGMVFKYGLNYQEQKSVTVSMNKMFLVSTATYFLNPREKITLI